MTETRTPTDVADMEARWATIQLKLEANADALATQGTLVAKAARGRRVWTVRYFVQEGGRRVHRSIYVGDRPDLIERTRHFLEECRRPGLWTEEVEGYARLAARAGGIVRRLASGRGRPGWPSTTMRVGRPIRRFRSTTSCRAKNSLKLQV